MADKLSRAEIDEILVANIVAYAKYQAGPRRIPVDEPASVRTLASFRAALRLDDPVLTEIIESRTGPIQWSERRALEEHA